MRSLLISLLLVFYLTSWAQSDEKRIHKFNPVYGSQSEMNALLLFVSENLKVDLSENNVKDVIGYMTCRFRIDSMGNITAIRVGKSLRPWIDYAIIGAMNRMPPYGNPVTDHNGNIRDVERQLVFSFGKFFKPITHIGFNGEKVSKDIQNQIDEQRNEANQEKMANKTKWDNFTKENASLKYDSRDALKGKQPVLPSAIDPLARPIISPTISAPTVLPSDAKNTTPTIKSEF